MNEKDRLKSNTNRNLKYTIHKIYVETLKQGKNHGAIDFTMRQVYTDRLQSFSRRKNTNYKNYNPFLGFGQVH